MGPALTVALTIAGSDPTGGAGVQADLRTFGAFGVFGTAAITALTVQDASGVHTIRPTDAADVERQIDAVLEDGPVHAAKSGMLVDEKIVRAIAGRFDVEGTPPLVVDPVLRSSSGTALIDDAGIDALLEFLFPAAFLVTPNAAEAARLTGLDVDDVPSAIRAAEALRRRGAQAALVTGGTGYRDAPGRAVDVLVGPEGVSTYDAVLLPGPSPRGTGCALSAAIAAGIANRLALDVAVQVAVDAVRAAIASVHPRGPDGPPVLMLEHAR